MCNFCLRRRIVHGRWLPVSQLRAMERRLLRDLSWNLLPQTSVACGRLLAARWKPAQTVPHRYHPVRASRVLQLLDAALLDDFFLRFYPSAQAAAAIALQLVYQHHLIPVAVLEQMTGFAADSLALCVAALKAVALVLPVSATHAEQLRNWMNQQGGPERSLREDAVRPRDAANRAVRHCSAVSPTRSTSSPKRHYSSVTRT